MPSSHQHKAYSQFQFFLNVGILSTLKINIFRTLLVGYLKLRMHWRQFICTTYRNFVEIQQAWLWLKGQNLIIHKTSCDASSGFSSASIQYKHTEIHRACTFVTIQCIIHHCMSFRRTQNTFTVSSFKWKACVKLKHALIK